MAITLPDLRGAADAAKAAGTVLDRILYLIAITNPLGAKIQAILDLVQGGGDGGDGSTPPGPHDLEIVQRLEALQLQVSALDNEYSMTMETFQASALHISDMAASMNYVAALLPEMGSHLGYYGFNTAGVDAFMADYQSGLVTGDISQLVLMRQAPHGNVPVLNPQLLTFSNPAGTERYSILETLVDALNMLSIYPKNGVGQQEI